MSEIEMTLAKLAGLMASVDRALGGELRSGGAGWGQANELVRRYVALSQDLRKVDPAAYGDIPQRNWSFSIASQKATLRDLRRDIEYILALAAQLGHYRHAPRPLAQAVEPKSSRGAVRSFFNHTFQVVIALLIAYLIFRFGWN